MATQPTLNVIRISNPPLSENARTYLTSDIAASAVSLPILSKSGFYLKDHGAANFHVILLDYGQEKAEIKLITANDTVESTLTCAAVTFGHDASDPVTYIPYNQIRFYGMTSASGDKNLLATLDIDVSQQFTEYTYAGDTYSYFCSAYYNSTSDTISAYSEIVTGTSFTRNSAKSILKSAEIKAFTKIDENPLSVLNWDTALEILMDGVDEILTKKRKWRFLHGIDDTQTTTSGVAYISQPSDVLEIEHISVNNMQISWMSHRDYNLFTKNGTSVITGVPTQYTLKNNRIYFDQIPDASYAVSIDYWARPANITSLSSAVTWQFRVPLVLYCGAHFAWLRGNEKRGDKLYALYEKVILSLIEEYSGPLQSGDAEYVEYTAWEGELEEHI